MVARKSEENEISRDRLAELLNEDLSREYQAIIALRSVFSGTQRRGIHGHRSSARDSRQQELDHALTISRQIDYLGKMPAVTPKPVRTSKNARDMLRYDLDNENETIRELSGAVRKSEAVTLRHPVVPVSYTHLTLPTNREV